MAKSKHFIVSITGTPCTGKSTLARELSLLLHANYVDLTEFIKKHKLHEGYDRSKKAYVVDPKVLTKALIKYIKAQEPGIYVVDGLLSHYLPAKCVGLCIVTICELQTLKQRLQKRAYSLAKTQENMDSEIMQVCLNESKELGHNILVVDGTKAAKKTAKTVANYIKTLI